LFGSIDIDIDILLIKHRFLAEADKSDIDSQADNADIDSQEDNTDVNTDVNVNVNTSKL
jgi:hypothetical protein